jgi:predicted PurR-regulated permease PerM
MKDSMRIPFYMRLAFVSINLVVIVYTLNIGQDIIIPIVFATLLAILLNPVVNFLTRKKVNRLIAIVTTVTVAFFLVGTILYTSIVQASHLSQSFPVMKEKFDVSSNQFVLWLSEQTNVQTSMIHNWLNEMQTELLKDLAVKESIGRLGHALLSIFILPVYMVLILFYKSRLLDFIRRLFRSQDHAAVEEVLASIKTIIQGYLVGLFIEMFIVAILNSIGLMCMQIEYALLLALLGAFLNLIPYLGSIIAATVFMIIALLTKEPVYVLYVFAMFLIVQFIDNNFLLPKVVASRVKINALVSIVVVIIGGTLWGIPGMFLAIPMTAILKVVFDHVDSLKAWGYVLGDSDSETSFKKK